MEALTDFTRKGCQLRALFSRLNTLGSYGHSQSLAKSAHSLEDGQAIDFLAISISVTVAITITILAIRVVPYLPHEGAVDFKSIKGEVLQIGKR